MKVKCIFKEIDDFSDPDILKKLNDKKIYGINLDKNREYNVYGIKLFEGNLYYFIFSDENYCFPDAYLADFFEIIDYRMSHYFKIYYNNGEFEVNSKEWIEDQSFYEKILDDYPDEIKKYREYKKLIDSEFPNLRMQFSYKNRNISFFSNQFGTLAGIVNEASLKINKWYDVEIKFTNSLEYNVNYFINEDYELKSCVKDNRLVMSLKIEELSDAILADDYIVYLDCYFNNCKINIPVVPYAEEIKVGDYVKIKCDVNQIKINIIDE